jgi:hypothetical protein
LVVLEISSGEILDPEFWISDAGGDAVMVVIMRLGVKTIVDGKGF